MRALLRGSSDPSTTVGKLSLLASQHIGKAHNDTLTAWTLSQRTDLPGFATTTVILAQSPWVTPTPTLGTPSHAA